MSVSASDLDQKALSKFMDDYIDGDGWRPNAADKVIIKNALTELDQTSDTHQKKIKALEFIRIFEQDGIQAAEWFKKDIQKNNYTPPLLEVLQKLVGVWNRKLRGLKTYVFVNEVVNYRIHELHHIASSKPFRLPK